MNKILAFLSSLKLRFSYGNIWKDQQQNVGIAQKYPYGKYCELQEIPKEEIEILELISANKIFRTTLTEVIFENGDRCSIKFYNNLHKEVGPDFIYNFFNILFNGTEKEKNVLYDDMIDHIEESVLVYHGDKGARLVHCQAVKYVIWGYMREWLENIDQHHDVKTFIQKNYLSKIDYAA